MRPIGRSDAIGQDGFGSNRAKPKLKPAKRKISKAAATEEKRGTMKEKGGIKNNDSGRAMSSGTPHAAKFC